ncbi:MAG: tRNA (adenosine(37)-N6)-threonylcarbamoyltransferase complex transferase subunit TsaD [Deltaproteobacteria bacterium]|nr:tRNA (adenosine(37)-N6)-threonylcarbamoyltransferase complex transferase subunit TsaD [Deltaproteobacteria bacterium]
MNVLGIESSCDETAASVITDGKILSDVISSQINVHKVYGGVVPELASRKHILNIGTVIKTALKEAELSLDEIHAVASTSGPGLLGSLVVGLQAAKSIALVKRLPFYAVNHLKGHILAARIKDNNESNIPEFPYMALLASGGHTGIYHVKDIDNIKCLGQTRDDAAGEAYDKVSKLLGLGYPGGPIIDKMASIPGDSIKFPQAFRQKRSYEFSFSGVKTAVAQYISKQNSINNEQAHAIAKGFQQSVVDILVRKVVLAAREKQVKNVVLAGGVAANSALRKHALEICIENDLLLFAPPKNRCTDNASMIAFAGYLALQKSMTSPLDTAPRSNWPL